MELAFEEGRARALGRRKETDGAATPSDTWAAVVSEEVTLPPVPDAEQASKAGTARNDGLPERIARTPLLDLPRDRLERIRLPKFLRRED
jgi:hypothetical protein